MDKRLYGQSDSYMPKKEGDFVGDLTNQNEISCNSRPFHKLCPLKLFKFATNETTTFAMNNMYQDSA